MTIEEFEFLELMLDEESLAKVLKYIQEQSREVLDVWCY